MSSAHDLEVEGMKLETLFPRMLDRTGAELLCGLVGWVAPRDLAHAVDRLQARGHGEGRHLMGEFGKGRVH